MENAQVSEIKVQLRSIRDQVNRLLDALDADRETSQAPVPEANRKQVSNGSSTTNVVTPKVNSSEFDPLQDKNQTASGEGERKESAATNVNNSGTNANESQEGRPQSVPVNTVPNQIYPRTTQGGYYRSLPYPQQQYAGYPQTGYVPQSVDQDPANPYLSGIYTQGQGNPQPYGGAGAQPNMVFAPQPGQTNPYSKTFGQTTPHQYMPR